MTIPAGEPPIPNPTDFDEAVRLTADRIRAAMDDGMGGASKAKIAEGSRIVWGLIYGHLRGRIPMPVPPDLFEVSVSAGMRVTKGFADLGTATLRADQISGVADLRTWTGFIMAEKIVLNRYRQRTA